MTPRIHRQSGFTVVEVVVVVLFVAIVATLGGIALSHAMDKARQRATMADMRRIATAIDSYAKANGAPPRAESIEELAGLLVPEYARDLPRTDQWGNTLGYRLDDDGGYSLESTGKDGVFGPDITLSTRFDFDLDIVLSDGGFVASPE
jgi:general secretion pathway protein G